MTWFDDLLNMQWWKDGVALPRRQIVNVTFPAKAASSNSGDIADAGAVLDRHDLRLPFYRPFYAWFLSVAPAVNALRFIRPYRDIYDTTPIVSQAFVVPKGFRPSYLGWQCAGNALTDSITFTAYKNGVATALSLGIAANQSGVNNDIFASNSTDVTWNKGDTLGIGVTQAGTAVQASWHAILVLQ